MSSCAWDRTCPSGIWTTTRQAPGSTSTSRSPSGCRPPKPSCPSSPESADPSGSHQADLRGSHQRHQPYTATLPGRSGTTPPGAFRQIRRGTPSRGGGGAAGRAAPPRGLPGRRRHTRLRGRAAGGLRRRAGRTGAAHLRGEGGLAGPGTAAARGLRHGLRGGEPGRTEARGGGRFPSGAHRPGLARQDPGRAETGAGPRCRRERGQFGEIRRIEELRSPGSPSVLGLRVNPQVGGGSIGAMSTATATSKFGVALRDPGARERVVQTFAERPWLTRLHAHVGSQGCSLELIAAGIAETYRLAEEINEALGTRRITGMDIGGGLPVNFSDDESRPAFAEYVTALRAAAPGMFDGRYELVTEFGRSLLAKNGFIGARVEYTKEAGGRRIALTHAGAQVATRTVFMPDAWPLRVGAFDGEGNPRSGRTMVQDIAGPCCFAGDLVAQARELPELHEGDFVILYDTGAYYFSTPWSYNSLPRPAVYGFAGGSGGLRFAPVREAQSLDSVAAESGLRHADALRDL